MPGYSGYHAMAHEPSTHAHQETTDRDPRPNLVTIVGDGVPARFELTVAGDLEMVAPEPLTAATIVSGGVAEGAIDVGIQQFRFSGEMANVRVSDWHGNTAPDTPGVPMVHVEYGGNR